MQTAVQWMFRGSATIAAMLATMQPLLGSFSFFKASDSINYEVIHGVAGAGIYHLSMVLVALAAFTGFRRRWLMLGCCAVQVVAVHVQLLLGVESGTDAGLLAYHIPLGVLIFLLTYLNAGLSFGARLEPGRA